MDNTFLIILIGILLLINLILVMIIVEVSNERDLAEKYGTYLYQYNIEIRGTKKEYDIYCKECGEKIMTCMARKEYYNQICKK
jgi:hypothetical protein